jgi:hypothetical protein
MREYTTFSNVSLASLIIPQTNWHYGNAPAGVKIKGKSEKMPAILAITKVL